MGKNIKFNYQVFGGLGIINTTSYSLDGNKLTITIKGGFDDFTDKIEVELSDEEMAQIESMFNILGEYSRTPDSKEKSTIFDAGFRIEGNSDDYEPFSIEDNNDAVEMMNKIIDVIEDNHDEILSFYDEVDAKLSNGKGNLGSMDENELFDYLSQEEPVKEPVAEPVMEPVEEKHDDNFKLNYSVFSGLGNINNTTYSIEGNKLTFGMKGHFIPIDEQIQIELTDEEMAEIRAMFNELGEYSKTPEGKESEMIFDVGYTINGSSDNYGQFEITNNEKGIEIVRRIISLVEKNHEELNSFYDAVHKKVAEEKEKRLSKDNDVVMSDNVNIEDNKDANIKFDYSVFSGFGDVNNTSYSLEGNKLTMYLSSGLYPMEDQIEVELSDKEMAQIEAMFKKLGEYSKTPESKVKGTIFDAGFLIKGNSDNYGYFEIENNQAGNEIVREIITLIEDNHKELDSFSDMFRAKVVKEKRKIRSMSEEERSKYLDDKVSEKKNKEPLKFTYEEASGLGEINGVNYTLEGNELTISMSSYKNVEEKILITLSEEEMAQIKEIFKELGEYSKTPESKNAIESKDGSFFVGGSSSEYDQFVMRNNQKALVIAMKIIDIIEANHNKEITDLATKVLEAVRSIKPPFVPDDNLFTTLLKDKYPSLFDENGNLKPESNELIDHFIRDYMSELNEEQIAEQKAPVI